MRRGEVWWASLSDPTVSGPGYGRPVIIVQADEFNASAIRTVIVAAITSNLRRAAAPGNVLLRARDTGLRRQSVANVSQLLTVDKRLLTERVGSLPDRLLSDLEAGLRQVLAL